jgi:hypothetical protein
MIKEKFFGRSNYLEILQKRVSALKDGYRQNIAIVGEENVGKSGIIFKFLDKFYDNRIITVYLEVRHETLDDFAKRFIGVLLYNFLSNSGILLKEDLNFLIARSKSYIPKTIDKVNEILAALAKRKRNNILSEVFNLTEIIHQETGKSAVLILDEFHNLENLGVSNIYREWSKLLILQKNTLYVIISSMVFKTQLILSKQLSLLFGNFEVIKVEPFDTHTSERYLEHKLSGQPIEPGLENFIINFTGGYPLYLELICEALNKTRLGALADILEGMLFDSTGILNIKFSNYLKRFSDNAHSGDYQAILYLISSGRNRIKEIAHISHIQKKELSCRVNHLLELDAITRSGDFLKISDRLFAYWLNFVYQGKLCSMTFDAKFQKAKFRDSIEEMIQEFLLQAKKPLTNRVSELMQLFEDDLMQIERKKIRLPPFREIKPLLFNHLTLKDGLLGRSSDSLWIMAIKTEALTEQDITDFAKECKKYHHKSQRKIMVTLKEIDANARLRALNEKILAWDLNSLNQIMDLFSKPRIIA